MGGFTDSQVSFHCELFNQMVVDVLLGNCLSGRMVSSIVVTLMSARPVKAFSIGFYGKGCNEAMNAKVVARRLGLVHTEFMSLL